MPHDGGLSPCLPFSHSFNLQRWTLKDEWELSVEMGQNHHASSSFHAEILQQANLQYKICCLFLKMDLKHL